MKKLAYILGFILILVLALNQSNAMTIRAEASPQILPGKIEVGLPFTVDIYMNNNDSVDANPFTGNRYRFSMPLSFFSPNGSIQNVDLISVGGYPVSNIEFLNGFVGFWNLLFLTKIWSYEGLLPDTINFTGIGAILTSGWPFNLGELLYIRFYFQIDEIGVFCIDSIGGPEPTYNWLFDSPIPNFNGPYCWEVINPDPIMTISPDKMYAFYAYTYDSVHAQINLYILESAHSVSDIDISTVVVNNSVIPVSFEYPPADSLGEALRINVLTREFLPPYLPAWDTSMQSYSVTGQFTDGSEFSSHNWFELIGHRSGDANGDGNVDIFDISYLISYLYLGGSVPRSEVVGDINGDCSISLFDITYLINHLYNDGPPPQIGCE